MTPLARWVAALALAAAVAPARAEEPRRSVRPAAIRVEGLVRTREEVVLRELGFRAGDVVTPAAIELATARLWNTSIFARVSVSVVKERGREVVVVRVEDRWTLNPLFKFGSGGRATFVRVGAADSNVAGRFLEIQAQYENFDGFHGGQLVFRDPRLFDRRLEASLQLDRLVRPRPGFSDQRTQAVFEVAGLAERDVLRAGVRVSGFTDRFLDPLEPPAFAGQRPTETLLFEPVLRLGRVDTIRLLQRGASLELRPGLGFLGGDGPPAYASSTAEALAFRPVGDRTNLALRVRLAEIADVPPHLQLYAGGLDLLRGFPDNYVRARVLWLANAEVRVVAFDSTWFALMVAGFVDAAIARPPSGPIGAAASAGAGLRLLVPKFVATGLRVDLAVPLATTMDRAARVDTGPPSPAARLGTLQPSFGIYQFF